VARISTEPGVVGVDADDAMVVVFDQAGDLVLHQEMEGGKLCGLCAEEVEEVPLGHEGDELCVGGEVGEVAMGKDSPPVARTNCEIYW
jgi:hypothetical protein